MIGNLESRQDNLQGLWEGFDYDDLNRVETITTHAGSGSLSKTNTYDALGNITSKPGMGTYTYDPNRPHVIATAGEHTYIHDANGNMTSGADRTFTWNRANLPTQISKDSKSLSFSYGPDRARFKQVAVINGATETTFYIGGLYEKITKGSLTTHRPASVYFQSPWIAAAYSSHITNLKGGSTGDIAKAGAIAGAAAYAGQYVAASGWTADVQILGYIGIGTAAGVASGGDVGGSFAASAITAGASAYLGQSGVNPAVGYIVSATLGGTASEISGGKFANGAVTGAFGYAVGEAMRRASGPPGRALTTDEIAAARGVFGEKINYDSVRIIDDKYFFLQSSDVVMAPDGNIYWPGECGNLATCQGGVHVGTYIHEMTHVLQYQHGVNVLGRGFFLQASYRLSFGLYDPYDFTYDPSRAFSSYNIEQQGDIARGIYFGRYRNNIDY